MKTILVGLLFLCLAGCAHSQMGSRYMNEFNDAVSKNKNTSMFSSRPFETVKDDLLLRLKVMGYEKALYADPEQGFVVVGKQGSLMASVLAGDPNAEVILVKFTNSHNDKVRIDLVNDSGNTLAKKSASEDIAALTGSFN